MILVLMALWMGAMAISLWAFFLRDAPPIGLDNLQLGLGWQGVGGLLAFTIWGLSYGLPVGHGVRRVAFLPLGIALGVAGLAIFGVLN